MEKLFSVIDVVFVLTFLLILIEYLYSKYKKDGVHYFYGTANNFLNGLFIKYILGSVTIIYFFYLTSFSPNRSLPDSGIVLVLNTIYCLVLFDFFNYIFHRLEHYFDFLWMFHSVHHSDKHVNLSTSYRLSFGEKLYNATPCIPLVLMGFHSQTILLTLSLHSLFAFFGHCQYIILPRFINYIFIVPDIHKIHHDENHLNKNYAVMFTFWDKLFGTYEEKIDNFAPGIKGCSQDNAILMQIEPIIDYLKKKI